MKVLIAEKLAAKAVDVLEARGFEVDAKPGISREELLAIIKDYDGLIIRSSTQVDRELINHALNLKVVGRAGVGVDNVDIKAATERGITVCNAPTSNSVSAAEHTMALMLSVSRNIPAANASIKANKWERSKFQGNELMDKTIAIFGLGRIGALVAERATAFGMRCIGYDPYLSVEKAAERGIEKFETLEEILPQADYITVHLPKTKETTGMFSDDQIALMRDGVYLINAARGGIYDEDALARGLESGKIAGVALDVYSSEPPADDFPLKKFDNAVLVPHLGASTAEAQVRAGVQIAEFVATGLEGKMVPTAINVARIAPDALDALKPYIEASTTAGRMIAQMFDGECGGLDVRALGQLAAYDPHILATAALRGIFSETHEFPVNLVNADYIAEQKGVIAQRGVNEDAGDYISAVRITAQMGTQIIDMVITVNTVTGEPRIVSLMGYKVDLHISKHMIVARYPDRPGALGLIATILGGAKIDIRNLDVSDYDGSDLALVTMTVDKDIPADIRKRLVDEIAVESHFINL